MHCTAPSSPSHFRVRVAVNRSISSSPACDLVVQHPQVPLVGSRNAWIPPNPSPVRELRSCPASSASALIPATAIAAIALRDLDNHRALTGTDQFDHLIVSNC